jgi:hypothetical protein
MLFLCLFKVPLDLESIAGSSIVRFQNPLKRGHGVVVSPHLVMTAVHGLCDVGTAFEIISLSNTRRQGDLRMVCYEFGKIDVALLQLKDGQPPFESWLHISPCSTRGQKLSVLSLLDNFFTGGLEFSMQSAEIHNFYKGTAFARAQYYSSEGMSGAPIVTGVQSDGSVLVVGVHVAAHDDTEEPHQIKKVKRGEAAEAESVTDSTASLAQSMHGHSTFCLMCIASKVPKIMDEILRDLQSVPSQSCRDDSTASNLVIDS